jgi:putative PIN family toxin of toxin-antitoxin system
MDKLRIVLDTNVLYAGLYSSTGASHQVLRAVDRGQIQLAMSTTLLFEYEEILRGHQAELGLSNRDVDLVLGGLCANSVHQRVYFLWRPVLPDPEDDHVLELAVACGADALVTHNMKHFAHVQGFAVHVMTPKQLLERLR